MSEDSEINKFKTEIERLNDSLFVAHATIKALGMRLDAQDMRIDQLEKRLNELEDIEGEEEQ